MDPTQEGGSIDVLCCKHVFCCMQHKTSITEVNGRLQKIMRFCTLNISFTHFPRFDYLWNDWLWTLTSCRRQHKHKYTQLYPIFTLCIFLWKMHVYKPWMVTYLYHKIKQRIACIMFLLSSIQPSSCQGSNFLNVNLPLGSGVQSHGKTVRPMAALEWFTFRNKTTKVVHN